MSPAEFASFVPLDYAKAIDDAASANGLDPAFVRKIVAAESGGNPHALSPKGAVGLMQVMPQTAADYGVTNPQDPEENIKAGIAHLARLNAKYGGDQTKIAAAYNAGEGAVDKAGGVPNFPETQAYVQKVTGNTDQVVSPEEFAKFKPLTEDGNTNIDKYKQQNPGLWEKIVARASDPLGTATDLAAGAVKGAAGTVSTLADAARKYIPGVAALDKVGSLGHIDTKPTNTVQSIGRGLEQAGEFVLPSTLVGKGVSAATKGAGLLTKIGAQAATQAAVAAPVALAQGENPKVAALTGALGGAITPAIEGVVPTLQKLSEGMGVSALKPTKAVLKKMPGGMSVDFDIQSKNFANYVLNNKLTADAARNLTKQFEARVVAAKAAGGLTVDGEKAVLDALQRVEQQYGSSVISKDIAPLLNRATPNMTPGEAHDLAKSLSKLQPNIFSTEGGVSRETSAAVNSALRTAAKSASPELEQALEGYGMAVAAKRGLVEAALRHGKREAVSPFTLISAAAGLPFAAATGGGSEVVAIASHILHKYPLQSAQMMRNFQHAIENKNIPLILQLAKAAGVSYAMQATKPNQEPAR